MESENNLVGSVVKDPFERLVVRVAACMISEPNYYETAQERVNKIVNDLEEVLKLEPEFISKLAYYSRNVLNLRSTSNFIAAWAASHEECRQSLTEFFCSIINLPSDLLDFAERYQIAIGNKEKPKFPTFLRTLIKRKFCDFNIYQLGKYCSEGKRKRQLMKKEKKNKMTMKYLVKICHIKRPAELVASIVGKRYPMTPEAFAESSFSATGEFKQDLAGKRMKIPTPVTWETALSEKGNKADCWESLIKTSKLPFMAMIRNIRNLLITGVDDDTHHKVCEKLRNPDAIEKSRMFPFRFLSSYESIQVNLEELQKIKNDPKYVPERPTGKRAMKYTPTKKIPKIVPTEETISNYKESLTEAIKLATTLNISPLRGHTVIFCDVSGSMSAPISSGAMGSIRTCMDVGLLFGVMMRHVCESCDFYLLSSPNPPDCQKCWIKVELEGDNIFELVEKLKEEGSKLGGGTDYPYDWFDDIIAQEVFIDNIIIFSDMIISYTTSVNLFSGRGLHTCEQILKKYRDKVNPNMRYVTVDLAGHARDMAGVNFEDEFKNLVIGGYSDAILKLISTVQTTQAGAVRACQPIKRREQLDN